MDARVSPMWEALVVRGVAAVLFGIAAVFWPGLTLVTLVYIISIYILFSGVVGIFQTILGMTRGQSWFLSMAIAVAEIGVGLYLVRHPNVTFATMVLLVGLILVARGVLEVVIALIDEDSATNKTLLVIGGILSVVVGAIVLLQPESGGVAFVWVLGLYALITGPILVAIGLDAKKLAEGTSKRR